MESIKSFSKVTGQAVKNNEQQVVFDDNVTRLNNALLNAKLQYSNLELARKRAGYIRHKAINGLEKYLIEFEANFERNGGKVIWALDADEAAREITALLKKHKISQVLKSRSNLFSEVGLFEKLEEENIKTIEVNPADFILRQFEERQVHPANPIIGKSLISITNVLEKKFKVNLKRPHEILSFIKNRIKSDYQNSTASITGANYVIADTGSISFSEDNGDSAINSTIPKIHIVLAGIDRIIPSLMNLDALLPLSATYSNGQIVNKYSTVISGPKQEAERDGPIEMYVVLVDNGRSNVLSKKYQRRALSCIECGACHNVCPVYRKIGGEAYGSDHTGPIGSIITPWMKGFEDFIHLSYATTLCGNCTEACPVMINLHDQLIYNRNDAVSMKIHNFSDGVIMQGWYHFLKSRKWLDWMNTKWKNRLIKKLYSKSWGISKDMPQVSQKSFKQLWEERREGLN